MNHASALLRKDDDRASAQVKRVLAAVAVSPAPPEVMAESGHLIHRLTANLKHVEGAVAWPSGEVLSLLGCPDPAPDAWRDARPEVLERSVSIVEFLATYMIEGAGTETQNQHFLMLAVELLSRLRGDVSLAHQVVSMDGVASQPLQELIAASKVGSARREMLRRLATITIRDRDRAVGFEEVELPVAWQSVAGVSMEPTYENGFRTGDEILNEVAILLAEA